MPRESRITSAARTGGRSSAFTCVIRPERVIGVPGDTVAGHNGRVFVNGEKADDIPMSSFPRIHVGRNAYFVLGDNRSYAQDSRAFGLVPRRAIFARLVLIVWPFARFGVPLYDKNRVPAGTRCG